MADRCVSGYEDLGAGMQACGCHAPPCQPQSPDDKKAEHISVVILHIEASEPSM